MATADQLWRSEGRRRAAPVGLGARTARRWKRGDQGLRGRVQERRGRHRRLLRHQVIRQGQSASRGIIKAHEDRTTRHIPYS